MGRIFLKVNRLRIIQVSVFDQKNKIAPLPTQAKPKTSQANL